MSKYPHYHKPVEGLKTVDVYRVLELFEVNDHAVGHAVTKLLCAGKRGGKDFETDIREAIDTLNRRLQMIAEDDSRTHVPSAPVSFTAWDGRADCPCPYDSVVTVAFRDGKGQQTGQASAFVWKHGNLMHDKDITGWRYAS